MNDLLYASMLFLAFAAVLVVHGAILAKTGNKVLLPLRATHSIRNRNEVKRVGRIVIGTGLVIGAIAAFVACLAQWGQ
jgi:hypothetical protein